MNVIQSSENEVHILLGLWGDKYITDFLEFGLLSLLAPGNIPAMAKMYKTTFVFLTQAECKHTFKNHPHFKNLIKICAVDFIDIDDLIVVGNHSTTITLAYNRAVQKTGSAMLNTYFIFLTADYIMADGSLEGLIRYLQKGYTGILAGNFVVNEEAMKPYLETYVNKEMDVLQIKPRELLKKSFNHLHTVSIASFYKDTLFTNYETNRLFRHYDNNLLLGRFFLLHMLCIRPETTDYQICASCDYSFIPEMCPSGNIAIIDDSDDYLVIEMQPEILQSNSINLGAYSIKQLAYDLAKWTTKQHRENSKQIIFYHSNDLPESLKKKIKHEPDPFIDNLQKALIKYKAQPYRNHPYWFGAIKDYNEKTKIIKNENKTSFFDFSSLEGNRIRKLSYRLFGYPLNVYRWHPRWLEYKFIKAILYKYLSNHDINKTIVLYDTYELELMYICGWITKQFNIKDHYLIMQMANSPKMVDSVKQKEVEFCLLFARLSNFEKCKKFLSMIKTILPKEAKVLICILNSDYDIPIYLYNFEKKLALNLYQFADTQYKIKNIYPIRNSLSIYGSFIKKRIYHHYKNKMVKALLFCTFGLCLAVFSFIRNCCVSKQSNNALCTAVFLNLEPNE